MTAAHWIAAYLAAVGSPLAWVAIANLRRTRGMADDQLFPELRSANFDHFPNHSHARRNRTGAE